MRNLVENYLSAAEFLFPGEYYTCAGYEVAPISSQRYRTDPKSRQSSDWTDYGPCYKPEIIRLMQQMGSKDFDVS